MILTDEEEKKVIETFEILGRVIHQTARDKGWWEKDRNFGEMVALMHSELSEALESERHGDPPSDHIPEFSGVDEEFADCTIRMCDTQYQRGRNLGLAIIHKIRFNDTRQHKHGGKKF